MRVEAEYDTFNLLPFQVLIFSQMTKMLDIIEDFCYMRKYSFSRIDGTMKVPDRQEMVCQFKYQK